MERTPKQMRFQAVILRGWEQTHSHTRTQSPSRVSLTRRVTSKSHLWPSARSRQHSHLRAELDKWTLHMKPHHSLSGFQTEAALGESTRNKEAASCSYHRQAAGNLPEAHPMCHNEYLNQVHSYEYSKEPGILIIDFPLCFVIWPYHRTPQKWAQESQDPPKLSFSGERIPSFF